MHTKPKAWDSSRVSASIPSGVGFLGAGLIVKSSEKDPVTGESHHLVQGITTAAATWYVNFLFFVMLLVQVKTH
jgi:putative Mg2+ transporter-C (MgtC) family protein